MSSDERGRFVSPSAGTMVESEDMNKWELEVEPFIDKFCHQLLGEIEDNSGVWVRNPNAQRIMNERGTTEVAQIIRSRVNIGMKTSELDDQTILDIASNAGACFADLAEDNYDYWELKGSKSSLRNVGWQIVDMIRIHLLIARNGGMRGHLERRGIKQYFNPQTGAGSDGGLM